MERYTSSKFRKSFEIACIIETDLPGHHKLPQASPCEKKNINTIFRKPYNTGTIKTLMFDNFRKKTACLNLNGIGFMTIREIFLILDKLLSKCFRTNNANFLTKEIRNVVRLKTKLRSCF